MTHLIIVGTSAAGLSCAAKIISLQQAGTIEQLHITMLSAEAEMPYNKCLLADYCAGSKSLEAIATRDAEFFMQHNITLRLNTRMTGIQPEKQRILLTTGEQLSYDWLLIATGVQPKSLPAAFESAGLSGMYSFHTLADIESILTFIQQHTIQHAVVIGGGLSGLEAADALMQHGIEVALIEAQSQVLPHQLDPMSASYLQERMQAQGVQLYIGESIRSIIREQGMVQGVQLADTIVPAQLIIIAIGAESQAQAWVEAGLEVQQGRLRVNEFMQTNHERILAAGDCCMTHHAHTQEQVPSALWPDAILQGVYAAQTIAGICARYPGIVPAISSSVFGIHLHCAGVIESFGCQLLHRQSDSSYRRVVITPEGIVRGYILMNERASLPLVRRSLLTQTPLQGEWT